MFVGTSFKYCETNNKYFRQCLGTDGILISLPPASFHRHVVCVINALRLLFLPVIFIPILASFKLLICNFLT